MAEVTPICCKGGEWETKFLAGVASADICFSQAQWLSYGYDQPTLSIDWIGMLSKIYVFLVVILLLLGL